MPFICLTNANIPDGTVQILDLAPNESQKNNALDGPGQTRYVNRVQNDALTVVQTGVLPFPVAIRHLRNPQNPDRLRGLAAYLADVVEPGGSLAAIGTFQANSPLVGDTVSVEGVSFTAVENTCTGDIEAAGAVAAAGALTLGTVPFNCVEDVAAGSITINGVTAGPPADTLTIAGVLFTAGAVADHANGVFLDAATAGSDILSADDLRLAIVARAAAITAALDLLTPVPTGVVISPDAPGAAVINLTASIPGACGDALLTEDTGGIRVTTVNMTHTDPVPANQEFGSALHYSGQIDPDAETATSLVTTINDLATSGLIDAANPGPAPGALSGHFVAAIDPANPAVVDLESSQVGVAGALALVSAQPGTLIVSGAALTHTAPAASAQEFSSLLDAGTNILVAGTLATALNNAATDAALDAAGGCSVTAVNGGTDTVTMTADETGTIGGMDLATSSVNMVVSGTYMTRAMETWTGTQLNAAAAALVARMDAGNSMTSTAINAAINAVGGGISGIDILSAGSNATVAEVLSILAGRGYEVPAGTVKNITGQQWNTTPAGSFTQTVQVFGDHMTDGEWKPTTPFTKHAYAGSVQQQAAGGDAETREYKPIRYTVDGTSFAVSVGQGHIQGFANGVTLWPDSSLAPFVPTWYQPGPKFTETANARLIVAYDDNGNVLA